jgi:hypothetical protein
MGELLLERHIITPGQLNKALEKWRNEGGYLSQHLIALGFATEADIATCLSNQYNFPYLPLKNYTINEEVLDIIPLKWIRIYTLIPVDKIGNILSIAMADPLNEGVIEMLKQLIDCEISVFISTYSELKETISKYYGDKLKDLEKHILDPRDMEKIGTVNHFVQTKAYMGPERRQYVRLGTELDISFYYRGLTFQGKTKDISYGGVSFVSENKGMGDVSFSTDIFMPLNTSLACKINLVKDKPPLDVIINVLRVQSVKGEAETNHQDGGIHKYEIAGVFEFISSDDRESILNFLKENII